MGRRGPPPKPTVVKIMEGNPGKRPLPADEPRPEPGAPACPGWLSKDARDEWSRVVPELESLGLLCRIDQATIAAYCQSVAELKICTELLDKEGRFVEEPIVQRRRSGDDVVVGHKKKAHPALRWQRDALARVRVYEQLFGLSASSRTRVKAVPKEESDPDEDFLNRGRG